MSMFRTLQSNPGIITFYKTTLASRNLELLTLLKSYQHKSHSTSDTEDGQQQSKSLWDKINNGLNSEGTRDTGLNYELEVVEHGANPTYDQLRLIFSYDHESKPITKEILSRAFPKFDLSSKTGTWNIPEEEQLKRVTDWFQPPLIVDWDKGNIADDIVSLKRLVEEYKK